MNTKKFTHGITFFVDQARFTKLKDISDIKRIGLSELLRKLIRQYLETQAVSEKEK
jgi:hypothetical protein